MERIRWIDTLRGFCMMAILWFHTEVYQAGDVVTPYALYVGNVLAVFFFLSGYLFYSPTGGAEGDFRPLKKLKSIVRYLVLPYFVFTLVIGIGKHLLFRHDSLPDIGLQILSGHASWFIAALIVSQLLFILLLTLTRRRLLPLALIATASLVLSGLVGNSYHPSPLFFEPDIWHFNEALLGLFLLFFGYWYHRWEAIPSSSPLSWKWIVGEAVVVILLKYFILRHDQPYIFGPLHVAHYPLFVADLLFTTLLLVHLFKRLPPVRVLEWAGIHSIAYYFICGAVPLLVTYGLHRLGITSTGYPLLLVAFLLVWLLATAIVWLVYRFTPLFKIKVRGF